MDSAELATITDDRGEDVRSRILGEVRSYLDGVAAALQVLPLEPLRRAAARLEETRWEGRVVYTCGNGGSAATAMHLASDLSKGACAPGKPDLRVICLADNLSILTALANDLAYDQVFARRLAPWVVRGDVLVAISASGNSPNVLNAVRVAAEAGATTIGLTGCQGGKLANMVDVCLSIPCTAMEQVEDLHLLICHAITTVLRNLPAGGHHDP